MVDTLQLAKDLQAGNAFTAEQAERIAAAVAKGTDDKRLRDVELKVTAQTAASAILAALILGVLWQLLVLRGEVAAVALTFRGEISALAAESRARFAEHDKRLDRIDARLDGIDSKLEEVIARLPAAAPNAR